MAEALAACTPTSASQSPAFAWRDDYALGHGAMDLTHREFVERVDALLRAPDAALADALQAFGHHARSHFAEEDRQMVQTRYASAGCHVDEHAAVLKSFDEVVVALAAGRPAVVRAFAQALADWFPEHALAMDQGLASWLIARDLGGAPVRLVRRAGAAA